MKRKRDLTVNDNKQEYLNKAARPISSLHDGSHPTLAQGEKACHHDSCNQRHGRLTAGTWAPSEQACHHDTFDQRHGCLTAGTWAPSEQACHHDTFDQRHGCLDTGKETAQTEQACHHDTFSQRHGGASSSTAPPPVEDHDAVEPIDTLSSLTKSIFSRADSLRLYEQELAHTGNPFLGSINARLPNAKDKFKFIRREDPLTKMLLGACRVAGSVVDLTELVQKCDTQRAADTVTSSAENSEAKIAAASFSTFLVQRRHVLQERGAIAQLQQINRRFEGLTILEKARRLATGADRFLSEDILANPNGKGRGMFYPEAIAPAPLVLEHVAKIIESGRGFAVRKEFANNHVGDFHSNPLLLAQKAAPPTMSQSQARLLHPTKLSRLCVDGTASGTNDRRELERIKEATTTIECDQLQDICQLILNAKDIWPGQPIFLAVDDIDCAYGRCAASELTTRFTAADFRIGDSHYVLFLSTLWFGFMESGYEFEVMKKGLVESAQARISAKIATDQTAKREFANKKIMGQYVDDHYCASPRSFAEQERDDYRRDVGHESPGVAGVNAISTDKTQLSQQATVIGYSFDLEEERVELMEKIFAKTFLLVFAEIPIDTKASDKSPLKTIQKLVSLAYRLANLVPFHRFLPAPFCSMLAQGESTSMHNSNVYWTESAITSLHMLRRYLFWAAKVPAIRSAPIWLPCHIARSRTESREERSERLLRSADIVLEVDASGKHQLLGGLMTRPEKAFCVQIFLEKFCAYDENGNATLFHINILELAATVVSVLALVAHAAQTGRSLHGCRIHALIDNTTAESHSSKQKTDNGIIRFLLSILFYLQIEHGFVFSNGRISSKDNKYADALSRDFSEEGMQIIKEELKDLPRLLLSQDTRRCFELAATSFATNGTVTEQLSATIAHSAAAWTFGSASE